MPNHPATWSREREVRLLALVAEGKRARDIARILGTTRNAVLGKLDRLRRAGAASTRIKKRYVVPVGGYSMLGGRTALPPTRNGPRRVVEIDYLRFDDVRSLTGSSLG